MKKTNKFISTLLRVLRPGAVWSVLLFLLGGAAVIFVLVTERGESVIGYISYVLSAYALTSIIVSFPKMKADTKEFIKTNKHINRVKRYVYENKYGNLLVTDVSLRVKITLYASLGINLIYSGLKLFSAFYYSSFWFGAEAVFYIVLSGIRFILLRNLRKNKGDEKRELLTYRFCGYLLFAMNAALTGIVYQTIHHGMGYEYPGLIIYAAAIFAFFCFTDAIIDIVKFRKYKSPILSAVKVIKLAAALVSMFSLQIAMFASFNEDNVILERIMNSVTGGLICCAIFAMAVLMVVQSFNRLKNIQS